MTKIMMRKSLLLSLFGIGLLLLAPAWGARSDWDEKDVNLRAGQGRQIKRIRYPKSKEVTTRKERSPKTYQSVAKKRRFQSQMTHAITSVAPEESSTLQSATGPFVFEVNTPPVDGFVPWISVVVTDERAADLEMEAEVEHQLVGRVPSNQDPKQDYIVGLFDTGASGSVIGYEDAVNLGLYTGNLVGPGETIVGGVVDAVMSSVSYPLGLFLSGLQNVEPETLALDTTTLKGESNVAVIVGQYPAEGPDLPTAIGAPMSVYYTTHFENDKPVTLTRQGESVTGPSITMYSTEDASAPSYDIKIPLELRPLGGVSVQYVPSTGSLLGGGDDLLGGLFGGGGDLDFPPSSPSIIIGNQSQSLFFVHSVDLYEGDKEVLDKDRFMLDTGAQVTVVGKRMASRLRLDVSNPEFEVDITGVTGNTIVAPGFNIDRLEIPALGEWFIAKNVPVILLDVSSPEGGTLDGIIGMNLFVDFNLIVRGGGLFLQDDPSLELQPISVEL